MMDVSLEWVLYGFDDDGLLEVKHRISPDRYGLIHIEHGDLMPKSDGIKHFINYVDYDLSWSNHGALVRTIVRQVENP